MSTKNHATLLQVASAIWLIATAACAVVLWTQERVGTAVVVIFAGIITMVLLWEVLLLCIPIECDQPGCHGQVGHKWVSQEPFHYIVRYVCQDCGHEIDAPINFTFGGGNSWD